jgi:hypothetical protein
LNRYNTNVRWLIPVLTLIVAAVGSSATSGASATAAPSYTVTFAGTGTERHLDDQQNIQDSGACDSAEHNNATATIAWSASWTRFRPSARSASAGPARIDGSTVLGTDVKDACGLDLSLAPPGWVGQTSCSQALVAAGSASMSVVRKTAATLVLSLTAPPLAVPVGAGCALNVRNDQLAAHVAVPLKKLSALRKRSSLVLHAGTSHPGPGDLYATSLDCSQPTKPYDGYRTADRCQDELSWSGTVTITRAS